MTTFVCFLRGINVGGNNPLKMAELRSMLETLGFDRVETYIASGNIVFDTSMNTTEAAEAIADGIAGKFGYELSVTLRTADQLAGVIAANPYSDAAERDPKKVVVFFLDQPGDEKPFADVLADYRGPESAMLAGGEFYVHFPDGQGRSKFPVAKLERAMDVSSTARNWNTVRKMAEILGAR